MGDSAHTTHHTNPKQKKSAPSLQVRTFFKNRLAWYYPECNSGYYHARRFLKNVPIFEKKGGADAFENDPPFINRGTVPR
jgi:hypothetical protein